MSWRVARPHDDELGEPRPLAVVLGPLLGASAVALVVLGILALLAAEGLEPFGGSVPVLAGLLGGAALVVAGLAGVARRTIARSPRSAADRDVVERQSFDHAPAPDGRAARQRADETRIMRTVAAGPPPPPLPTPRRAPARAGGTPSRSGTHIARVPRRSSRTSA